MTGVGATLVAGLAIVTARVVLAALPHTSVSVNVTVYVPSTAHVLTGVDEVLVAPASPKFHR